MRPCGKCGELRSSSNCASCNKAYKAAYYAANRDRLKPIYAKNYAKNKSDIRKRHAEYYSKNRDQLLSSKKEYRLENKEKLSAAERKSRAKNIDGYRITRSIWNSNNRESIRINQENRRARKLKAGGKLSKGLAKKLFKLQRGKCACCNKPLGNNYHMDHIMPIALGGTNTDDNIQLLTALCNMQKTSRHPIDFMQSRGFLL